MAIKAVIFDLDGTIADTVPLTVYSLRETARHYTGKTFSDDEILKEFGPIDTEIIKKFVEKKDGDPSVEDYVKHFTSHFDGYTKPIDGMLELVQYLKDQHIKIGLFTGRSLRVTEIILKKLRLKEYFDVIIPGDDTKKPKPDPEGIHMALDILGVKSSEGVYVGDFDVDILASKAAGTLSVLALWATTKSAALIDLKPDKFFTSPFEFISWLKGEQKL